MNREGLIAAGLNSSRLSALATSGARWEGIVVVNYHRIGDGATCPFDRVAFSVTADQFERQVSCVAKHFEVVGPHDLIEELPRGAGRRIMLTLDDGYRDNYSVAFPILKQHGVQATFFVTTGYLDCPQVAWWDEIAWMVRACPSAVLPSGQWLKTPVTVDAVDREPAISELLTRYKQLSGYPREYLMFLAESTGSGRCPAGLTENMWMTWDMVRELDAAGMSIGAHTVNHPILGRLSPEDQDAEIGESKRRIEAELGHPVSPFAYPDGSLGAFDEVSRAAVERHGFQLGFSFYGGVNCPATWNRFDIRRTRGSAITLAEVVTAAVRRRRRRLTKMLHASVRT